MSSTLSELVKLFFSVKKQKEQILHSKFFKPCYNAALNDPSCYLCVSLCSLCQLRQVERSLSTQYVQFPRCMVMYNIHRLLPQSVCSLCLELSYFKHSTTCSQHCVDKGLQNDDSCLGVADEVLKIENMKYLNNAFVVYFYNSMQYNHTYGKD